MDFPCESEISVRNENALRFTVVSKPAPVIEYLKVIASLIGASHILGVFEGDDFIKVYFDDKKYVDSLIRSGIHVMGHHIKVDYVVPPGSKVVLSNIDPVVSNYDLTRLMSMFGSVVSPVFRLPISDDVELCHIDYGVRYVYVDLNMTVPEILEFKYGDQICKVNIKLDDSVPEFPHIKKEPTESNATESSSSATSSDDNSEPINIDDNSEPINVGDVSEQVNVQDDLDITDPVLVSVRSAAEEINTDQTNKDLQIYSGTNNPVIHKHNLYKTRRGKLIKTSQNNTKIKPNVKYKSRRAKKIKISRNKGQYKNVTCIKKSPQTPLNMQPSPVASSPTASLSFKEDSFICEDSKDILDEGQFKLFLNDVRWRKDPLEVVKKYLEPSFDSNALRSLINQLNVYKRKNEDLAVKVRVRRLINNLKSYLETF